MAVVFAKAILRGGKWRANQSTKGGEGHDKLKQMWTNYLKAARPWRDIVNAFGVGVLLILPVTLSNETWDMKFTPGSVSGLTRTYRVRRFGKR